MLLFPNGEQRSRFWRCSSGPHGALKCHLQTFSLQTPSEQTANQLRLGRAIVDCSFARRASSFERLFAFHSKMILIDYDSPPAGELEIDIILVFGKVDDNRELKSASCDEFAIVWRRPRGSSTGSVQPSRFPPCSMSLMCGPGPYGLLTTDPSGLKFKLSPAASSAGVRL